MSTFAQAEAAKINVLLSDRIGFLTIFFPNHDYL